MRRTYRLPHSTHLGLTIGLLRHGGGDPTFRLRGNEAWWATRTPDGPATVQIRLIDATNVEAEAWGPGSEAVLDRLPQVLGADDDLSGFSPDPTSLVGRMHRRLAGLRLGASGAVFEALLPTIIEQKVPGKQAKESYRRIVYTFGEPAPGPARMMLQPAPDRLAALAYHELHPFGVERKRADVIRRAAARASRLEEALTMDSEAALARLMAIPGIGIWTAAGTLHAAAGDPDAVQVGDYHLPNVVAWNLAGEPRADDDRMLELLEPFRGHRARVARLLHAGGRTPPRYGPRIELQRIEGI